MRTPWIFGALCLPLLAAPVLAQRIILPPRVLQAPVAVAPTGAIHVYDYNAPNMSFVWNQHPWLAGPGTALPNHFLFCLRRIGESDCSHATALQNLLPGQLTSSILRATATFTPIGVRYTLTPTLPDDRLDHVVRWQVAGCTSSDDSSCRFSAHTWIVLATMDVEAVSISASVIGDTYSMTGYARNRGSRATREFTAHLETWEVIFDPVREDCLEDPNDPSVRNDLSLFAVDRRGAHHSFLTLPRDAAGNFVVSDVIGIYRPANDNHWFSPAFAQLVLPPTAGMSAPLPRTAIGSFDIQVPANSYPRAFVHRLGVDYPGRIDEPNELDNSFAECEALL